MVPWRTTKLTRMSIHDSNGRLPLGLFMAGLLAICASVRSADKRATLKDAYQDHFLVGTAVNRSMVGGATFRRSAEQTASDVGLLKEQFNQISPENDLKWQIIHPREGADGYDFGPADAFVNFGLSNKMVVVGTRWSGTARRPIGCSRARTHLRRSP